MAYTKRKPKLNPFHFLLFSLLGLYFCACQKNTLQLPPNPAKPITSRVDLNFNGSKIADLEIEILQYVDSNRVAIKLKNVKNTDLDSLEILLYYFQSNVEALDSLVLYPSFKKVVLKEALKIDTLKNIPLPRNTKYFRAEILSFGKKKNPKPNSISGQYNGYVEQSQSNIAYKSAKGFITAEGQMKFWYKDVANTFRIEAIMPNDTQSLENIFLQDKDGVIATQLLLDTIAEKKNFNAIANKLGFKIKNKDTASVLKSLKFNLVKN